MTYTMVKKSPFKFPTERYKNIVKNGYESCSKFSQEKNLEILSKIYE